MNDLPKILVVEDESLIAHSIKRMLQPTNIVEIALDFEEAKTWLYYQNFDLVLIDITLSGKKTGFDLAQLINENFSIPFIYTTALTDPETLLKVKSTKPCAYLSKPIERVNLITAIELALENVDHIIKIELGKKNYHIHSKDFLYMQSDHIYVEIFMLNNKKLLLRTSLAYLEKVFTPKHFKRVNRSVAVNPYYITFSSMDQLVLGDLTFKVSKNF